MTAAVCPTKCGIEVHQVLGGWVVCSAWNGQLYEQLYNDVSRDKANNWAAEHHEDTFPGIYEITGNAPYLKLAEVPNASA